MLRSIYSGITGMKINQLWFDVIAGNMANVNTPGFKKSRISFEDLLNHTLRFPLPPVGEVGGINPMQIGLGSTTNVIQVVHTSGTVRETNISTDLLINGDGYFIVSDGSLYNKYTRAGNFTFDNSGNLINQSNGFKVLGWNAERNPITAELLIENDKTIIDKTKGLEPVVIRREDTIGPKATTTVGFEKGLNASTPLAFSEIDLNFTKYISSVVSVSKGARGIDLSAPWITAGFENPPTGKIELGPIGYTKEFFLGLKPQDLIDAINNNSSATGISIRYRGDDKFILEIDPENPRIKETNGRIILSETPEKGKTGFFTEAKILTGEYNSWFPFQIEFDHLLDPESPNNYYLRWKAVDASNNLISTNAYYYVHNDYGIPPGNVADEFVGISDGTNLVFELDNPDVDPRSLQIYVENPATGEKILYEQYKLPWQKGEIQTGYNPGIKARPGSYYFDDNGQTEIIYPLKGEVDAWEGDEPKNIGKSKYGLDRIIFISHPDPDNPENPVKGPPPAGYKITASYIRNGFNMSESTIDPTTLQVKVDGALQDRASYTFNNNLGIGGKDQVTLFSIVSEEEVCNDSLDIAKPFKEAGFNCAPDIVMPEEALHSTITISWEAGQAVQSWTSGQLKDYVSVADFLATVTASVNEKAGKEIIKLTYDSISDKFRLENYVQINIGQSNEYGFLTHAKLPGEGQKWTDAETAGKILLPPYKNPESREEVVKNFLEIDKMFIKAGFNNGFPMAESEQESAIRIEWKDEEGNECFWESAYLETYHSINAFLSEINQAVGEETGSPLKLTIRYDPETDRFTIANFDPSVRIKQTTLDGFLTKAKLLTEGVGFVPVPTSPIDEGKILTASYNYNKTVEAKGILQLDENYKVINNFKDTEAVPVITSSMEVISGPLSVNLTGDWTQFDSGTIRGTITIETDSGIYVSREINAANYPTVQSLLNEINTSDAKVVIEYDPTTDKFTLRSLTEGARITLSETGTIPFFTEINFTLGTIQGGNNNGVMDLARERPRPEDGWTETTGPAGTGRDFFRVNIRSNEVKDELLGIAGKGKPGTQVMKAVITKLEAPEDLDPGPDEVLGWKLDLPHRDVDKNTLAVYYSTTDDPDATKCNLIPSIHITFNDNAGTGGKDQIIIRQYGDPAVPDAGNWIYVDYTRLNAFDLKNPDADETTVVLKVNGVIQESADYTFQDNKGTNGVDRIILDKSYGAGMVEIDYRQVSPLSTDIFIPNGNRGPENITFIPNTAVDTTYYGNKTSDLGDSVTARRNNDYIVSVSRTIYDAIGKAWDITYKFEKLSTHRWLWTVLNPIDQEKFSGYGIIVFDKDGNYDKDNSRVFESPSDERFFGGRRFKGIFFDPEGPNQGPVPLEIFSDFTKLHQFAIDGDKRASSSNVKISFQDGYPKGELKPNTITINASGMVLGEYTNGLIQSLGQIALARFINPSGLLKESATLFSETLNSGKAQIGEPGKEGMGTIAAGRLEMANVDLVEEFTDLIISQRAFQANSRIIITDDQILTEIVNMKR